MKSTVSRATTVSKPSLSDLLAVLGHRDGDRLSINSKKEGQRFLSRIEHVASLAEWTPLPDRNVYFGVNPVRSGLPLGSRGKESDVTRVYVLFADLDVKGDSLHSLDECREVVDGLSRMLGVNPTAVIESGHGLQPLYRIASPSSCSNVIAAAPNRLDRDGWRELYARWHGAVHTQAQRVRPGAKVDSVYNLDRILRAPGSINHKADPIAVRTQLFPRSEALTWRAIREVFDRDDVQPIGGAARVQRPSIPTRMVEALEWIKAQPGATLTVDELMKMHPSRTLLNLADRSAMVATLVSGDGDEASVHSKMLRKIQHAVFSSCENKAGLALALDVIRDAYCDVMELRRAGLASGEARSDAEAVSEVERAVRGAVAVARARGNSPEPQRDSDGRIAFRYRAEKSVNEA